MIDSEIRTILIGSAWRLHYEHTWSRLNFGLWNPPCYCKSRNPQVFLTQVVPSTTIYIFEDINNLQNQNIVKTRLVFLPIKARKAEILLEGFNDHFSGYWMYFLLPGIQFFWTTVPMSRGSYRVQTSIFVEILWELIPESEYKFFLRVETSIF